MDCEIWYDFLFVYTNNPTKDQEMESSRVSYLTLKKNTLMKNLNLLLSGVLLMIGSLQATAQNFNGYALFNDMGESITYLIDKNGDIAHTWSCATEANYTVKLKDNGNIMRGGIDYNSPLFGAAAGGIVQELDANANIVWQFNYSNSQHLSHHDLEILPNGNVLLIAWEVKSSANVIQAGYDGSAVSLWPTQIIEVAQNGTGGQIVWEWHIWDHMIQDYDASKNNYGVVVDHPELMDVNAVEPWDPQWGEDWFHVNGIGYNADLDQIVFTSRTASELFVIDHSTTTAQAASHAGGNSGKGGDFLYRWGNSSNYGGSGSQTVSGALHDPRWITDDGRTNGGYIQFFNNVGGGGGGSAVDAIQAPVSGFIYTMTGNTYAPSSYDWRHNCLVDTWGQSSSNIMSNGNVFVNVSNEYMYEQNSGGTTVWQYNAGPAKAFRYECDHPGIIALLGENPCGNATLSEETLSNINIYPNPSTGTFAIDGVELGDNGLIVSIYDMSGKMVIEISNGLTFDLSSLDDGIYFANLNFNNDKVVVKKLTLVR